MHPLAQTEMFGPVLAIMPDANEDQAVAIAGNTIYGFPGGAQCVRRTGREAGVWAF